MECKVVDRVCSMCRTAKSTAFRDSICRACVALNFVSDAPIDKLIDLTYAKRTSGRTRLTNKGFAHIKII